MHQIGKRWKLSKWVPHDLTSENRLQRLTICSLYLTYRILTCDEKWVIYTNRKRTYHWLSPKDPLAQISKVRLFSKKLLLCLVYLWRNHSLRISKNERNNNRRGLLCSIRKSPWKTIGKTACIGKQKKGSFSSRQRSTARCKKVCWQDNATWLGDNVSSTIFPRSLANRFSFVFESR